MANLQTSRKLASELARAANDYGGSDAQRDVYLLFLKRCMPDLQIDISAIEYQFAYRVNEVLDHADFELIFSNYRLDSKSPAVYFYEEFLRACDPKKAGSRGVHYSPPSVVSYMARGVESILQSEFGIGLDNAVVVDPCCGTGTFLKHIIDNFRCSQLVGIELLPDAAEIAGCLLKVDIRQVDALSILDIGVRDKPFVVIGNPPYSGHSSNTGVVESLLADYKYNLNEKNPKWLQDDYVKFIRIAQQWVDKAGVGIVAFITNHSYLFNPTFRAMRKSLMRTFDHLYILDLNGNAKINASGLDENVFPIQMGVAVSFMIKTTSLPDCKISHASILGSRKDKLDKLSQMAFSETPWEVVSPVEPFNIFKLIDQKLHEEFYSFPSILDLFKKSSVGFVTSRDAFAVDTDKNALLARIDDLRDDSISPDEIRARYAVGDLDIEKARHILQNDPDWKERVVQAAYRPFDKRYTYLSKAVMERPRLPFMENMLKDNIALAIGRAGQVTGSPEWDVIFCVDRPADLNLFRRGGAMLFPKYLYTDGQRPPNSVIQRDDIFYYIYALCHSSEYRRRYADFLKFDYPRIPITNNNAIFESLAELGRELVEVHLAPNTPMDGKPIKMTIGGYAIPFGSAVVKTMEIRGKINDLISQNPPW